jgi:hypothetical protein
MVKNLILLTIAFISFSCAKQRNPQDTDLNRPVSAKSITYYENMESATLFSGLIKQTTAPYALTKDSTVAFVGTYSARFELRDTDAMNNNGTRAEVVFPIMTATDMERWYSWQVAFDANDYDYDTNDEVIMQWHQGGGLTPALCFRVKQDKIWLRVMGTQWYDLGTTGKPYLQGFVMHVKHAPDSSGLIEVWKNHTSYPLVIHGQNMYTLSATVERPTLKLGIYKSGWNDNNTTMTNKRVLYYDNVRIGDQYSAWEEFINSY